MKFLHVGDLHIGKQLNQKSLITDQKHMLNEIIEMMEDNDINTLLIAGDIYDKQIPSKEAVKLFNDFLVNAILDHKYKIYIISGNHDSIERLNFASSILKSEGLYIETYGDKFITKYEIKDKFGKVNLFMLVSALKPAFFIKNKFSFLLRNPWKYSSRLQFLSIEFHFSSINSILLNPFSLFII